jgi:fructose-1-phosphate kinase PfkB-like protein
MIICVTPNVAVDRTYIVPTVRLGTVLRSTRTLVAAGGKGLNVARAISILGGAPLVMGLLGGRSGETVAELAVAEALPAYWSWAAGETRNCAILVGEDGSPETVINDRGGKIPISEWLQFIQDIVDAAQGTLPSFPAGEATVPALPAGGHADAVCICGSLPPGTPPHAPADLIEALLATGTPVWLDASGPALLHALDARPNGIKINHEEAGALLGQHLPYLDDAHAAARTIGRRGIDNVIITLGARGAVFHSPQGEYHLRAPHVEVVSAAGSGDAFLAGLLVARSRALPDAAALAWAVAAGAANSMMPGGGNFARADFDELLAELQ